MDLNPEQSTAVQHKEGPMLVIAGAGSGKTRIITARIHYLLSLGIPASHILAVTFTNKAAGEMRERIHRLSHTFILTTTFHSLGAKILREFISSLGFTSHFTIFDEEESEKLIKECLKELNIKDEKGLLKTVRLEISQAKNSLTPPKDQTTLYDLYQKKLKEANAVDFDDLLFLPLKLFQEFPAILSLIQERWRYILIDEYQDTNQAQYRLIQYLTAQHHNLFAVGDPDQSIYSWRGATLDNILNFKQDFPNAQVVSLEQNYRSTNTILLAANALINHNLERTPKNLWSELGIGDRIGLTICQTEQEEAEFVIKKIGHHCRTHRIPLKESVIFYRTNFQSRLFEDSLLRHKIPYIIIGGLSFYQRKEIKDILAFLRVVLNGNDFLAFSRTINLPKRGIGDSTLTKLKECAQENHQDLITTSQEIIQKRVPCKLSTKQLEGLKSYISLIHLLRELIKAEPPLTELLQQTIRHSHYLDYLKEEPEKAEERAANLQELIAKAAEWKEMKGKEALIHFLEELSLKSSLEKVDTQEDAVRLMTLHNGKGLEFTLTFLVGMEEDLFPHVHSRDDPKMLEEERRLCYVGMTRAKKYLYLSAAQHRFLWGTHRRMHPSRFLKEIPSQFLHKESDETEEEGDFKVGETIFHPSFGKGVIQKKYNTSFGTTYDINFSEAKTERSIIAKFAKLTPI